MLPAFGTQAGDEDRRGLQDGTEIDLIDAFAPDMKLATIWIPTLGKGSVASQKR